jgi:hypothetical protein
MEELMSDIVKRLREKIIVDAFAKGSISDGALCDRLIRERLDAADEIERLRAENEKLREALKPFAYYASIIPDDISGTCSASGSVGDLRAARKALGETDD